MGKRRQAREVAFQLIYALELSGDNPDFVSARYSNFKSEFEEGIWIFAKVLYDNTVKNSELIETQLADVISNWSIDRVSKIDKAILKLGCAEVMLKETPFNVVVDEMIELAKMFAEKDSPSFINGVLDNWHKKYC